MGIVNASPESFSGDGRVEPGTQADLVRAQFAAGALVVDIGGQSANTRTPELAVAAEIDRLVPLITAVRASGEDGVLSVDTYKPAVADACLAAGADIINDVSGLHDPELADVVATWGAGYALMHTSGPPKSKVLEPDRYNDVVDAVRAFVDRTLDRLGAAGVGREQIIVDPGLDFGKTPRQTLDVVARAPELYAGHDRPMLFAISRKDFIGAIASTSPRHRDPGTLAAVGALARSAPDSLLRVHDVAGVVQYLTVADHIARPDLLAPDAGLADHLRREPT